MEDFTKKFGISITGDSTNTQGFTNDEMDSTSDPELGAFHWHDDSPTMMEMELSTTEM
jgi:hypothetical protein